MKINKRLLRIAALSLAIALVLTVFSYKAIKKSVEPEKTEQIAFFKRDIEKGSKIKKGDIYLKSTPVSLVPDNAIRSFEKIEDKTLIIDATKDDFALEDNFIARGESKIEVDDMYQLGIKVDSIDNFLGTQLKEGEYYGLLYVDEQGNSGSIYKVKLVNMVDSTGKVVIESGEETVKAINIAVSSRKDMRRIAESKRKGGFELVKVPENKWESVRVRENNIENTSQQNN